MIRYALKEDLSFLAEIEKECIPDPWSLNSFESEFERDGYVFLTEEEYGEICGFITASRVLGEVSVYNVAVTEKYRRRGIAERLMSRLAEISDGAEFITLEVRESNNAAIRLYEKLGYKEVGRRKNFYSNPTENAILMTLFFND
ncbi:MAG: ribosomal protein S18-alanine N-acetyltransferase [Oscillospiraceae bacterium]|nr:ribosomal protein S18-alanine N-acetyltransferase [Oscillospiraceae bacterium]